MNLCLPHLCGFPLIEQQENCMREKLMTLPVAELRRIAKEQGIKGVSSLRKSEIVDKLVELDSAGKAAPPKKADLPEKVQQAVRNETVKEEPEKETAPAGEGAGNPPEGEAPRQGRRILQRRPERGGQSSGSRYGTERTERPQPRPAAERPVTPAARPAAERTAPERPVTPAARPAAERTAPERPVQPVMTRSPLGRTIQPSPEGLTEAEKVELADLDSGIEAKGILEVMSDGFGFIRGENFLPTEDDVYVAPSQIRRFNLKTGDIIQGSRRVKTATEKFAALLYINTVNGFPAGTISRRPAFENLTPIFPNSRIHLEQPGVRNTTAMRVMDLLAPIGKGQRGMIVSPPKAGKTTLLKQVAQAVTRQYPEMHLIILLIDERPEEVTDIREAITGPEVEVIYSTFDELPERHQRVSEMVIERAKRLVEHGRDVMILLDSITRLSRAYNLVVPPSGRTLSGGLDP
ncbi:MAG: transcription termination factor Rho, partial [Clostridium sp.]|nr:transcription termination factor Rho [Clostridium sp.]